MKQLTLMEKRVLRHRFFFNFAYFYFSIILLENNYMINQLAILI